MEPQRERLFPRTGRVSPRERSSRQDRTSVAFGRSLAASAEDRQGCGGWSIEAGQAREFSWVHGEFGIWVVTAADILIRAPERCQCGQLGAVSVEMVF